MLTTYKLYEVCYQCHLILPWDLRKDVHFRLHALLLFFCAMLAVIWMISIIIAISIYYTVGGIDPKG